MYLPSKYSVKDQAEIFQFITEHPFATFVINGDSLLATHIPIITKGNAGDFKLHSHIANHNPQKAYLQDGLEGLLIFLGPNSYISSSWYDYPDISTWDYSAVHINFKLEMQTDRELETSLQELVYRFEKDQENPIYYNDLPNTMIREHITRITGFWMKPTKVEAIKKLHQGFSSNNIHTITNHLRQKEEGQAHELAKNIEKEHGTDNS